MKKFLLLILLIILFMPLPAFAREVTIRARVDVEGAEIKKGEFSFVLKNQEGEIIQKKTNDENGNIVFDSVEIREDEEESIYFIEEENLKVEGYTYDENILYVKVNNNTEKVAYYKANDLEQQMKNEVKKYEPKEAYHATEEELQGEAYSVYDSETNEVYFRRYDSSKDNDFEWPFANVTDENQYSITIGTKTYYRYVEESSSYFRAALKWETKKIIFEDPIKPKFNDGTFLFGSLGNLEYLDLALLDTSNITVMTYMFDNSRLEELDLSTMETSQVTAMNMMFQNDYNLKKLDMTSFSADSLKTTSSMFAYCTSLSDLRISSKFETKKLENASSMFSNTHSLQLLDLSWFVADENTNLSYTFQYAGFKYMDLSHWNFENHRNLETTFDFATSYSFTSNLEYLDISNLTSPECGAYKSNDFKFQKPPKVIKTSHQYNFKYSTGGFTYYNVDNNIITHDLGPYDTCNYSYGGTYLSIQDEIEETGEGSNIGIVLFVNKYTPPKEPEAPVNPNTGDIAKIILPLLIISVGFVLLFKSKKRTS